MGHYLTESARTALEAMEPEEDVIEVREGGKTAVEPTLPLYCSGTVFLNLGNFQDMWMLPRDKCVMEPKSPNWLHA